MRLTALLTSALALGATAQQGRLRDQMVAINLCRNSKCDASQSTFFDSRTNSTWTFNANNDCRRATVMPDMYYCVDWYNRRAHYFHGSIEERDTAEHHCLLRDKISYYAGCFADRCEKTEWNPAPCTWDTKVPPEWFEGFRWDGHRGPESF